MVIAGLPAELAAQAAANAGRGRGGGGGGAAAVNPLGEACTDFLMTARTGRGQERRAGGGEHREFPDGQHHGEPQRGGGGHATAEAPDSMAPTIRW